MAPSSVVKHLNVIKYITACSFPRCVDRSGPQKLDSPISASPGLCRHPDGAPFRSCFFHCVIWLAWTISWPSPPSSDRPWVQPAPPSTWTQVNGYASFVSSLLLSRACCSSWRKALIIVQSLSNRWGPPLTYFCFPTDKEDIDFSSTDYFNLDYVFYDVSISAIKELITDECSKLIS